MIWNVVWRGVEVTVNCLVYEYEHGVYIIRVLILSFIVSLTYLKRNGNYCLLLSNDLKVELIC